MVLVGGICLVGGEMEVAGWSGVLKRFKRWTDEKASGRFEVASHARHEQPPLEF